ncbi:MAG TPA: hypothetical protein VFI23_15625 [Rhizomicrobium sp.]|nr:hypothetical protein [Rhizomicrobium sp.]
MIKIRTAMIAMAAAATMAGSMVPGSGALAADGALPPGKPAGVHQALRSPSLLLIGGVALVTVAAVVIATQSDDYHACGSACTSTPSTSTSP